MLGRERVLTAELEQTLYGSPYLSVRAVSKGTMVLVSALVYDIKVVSNPSRHVSQYSLCPSCHFFSQQK